MPSLGNSRDRVRERTPMRCPLCEGALDNVLVRDLGGVTADLIWELHAGECPRHGWFQTEVISRPPREIFAVDRPFGVVRRLLVDGSEVFSFPTVWNDLPVEARRQRVNPLDPKYWQVRRVAQSNQARPAAPVVKTRA